MNSHLWEDCSRNLHTLQDIDHEPISIFRRFGSYFRDCGFCRSILSVPTNFALLGGLSLFCGCYLRGWQRWALPLGTLGLSDGVGHFFGTADMGFYHPATMLSVYLGFGLMTLVGTLLNGNAQSNRRDGAIWVVGGAGLGSSLFFLISNFGSWLDPQLGMPPT